MRNPKVQFTKIRDVKTPNRANANDAGSDMYIPVGHHEYALEIKKENPNVRLEFLEEDDIFDITIYPQQKLKIPGGIKVNILDKLTYLDVANKSGIATNKCLVKLAHVIDADFRGELFYSIFNPTSEPVKVRTGQKIVQVIQKEYIPTEWEEISNQEYDSLEETDRGEGTQGSTGIF